MDARRNDDRFDDRDDGNNDREFYPAAERNGFNYGKSIVRMIMAMDIGAEREEQFLRGINKVIFRELKDRDNRFNRPESDFQRYDKNPRL